MPAQGPAGEARQKFEAQDLPVYVYVQVCVCVFVCVHVSAYIFRGNPALAALAKVRLAMPLSGDTQHLAPPAASPMSLSLHVARQSTRDEEEEARRKGGYVLSCGVPCRAELYALCYANA